MLDEMVASRSGVLEPAPPRTASGGGGGGGRWTWLLTARDALEAEIVRGLLETGGVPGGLALVLFAWLAALFAWADHAAGAPPSSWTVSPASYNFGSQCLGRTDSKTFTITNNAQQELSISSVSRLSSPTGNDFQPQFPS